MKRGENKVPTSQHLRIILSLLITTSFKIIKLSGFCKHTQWRKEKLHHCIMWYLSNICMLFHEPSKYCIYRILVRPEVLYVLKLMPRKRKDKWTVPYWNTSACPPSLYTEEEVCFPSTFLSSRLWESKISFHHYNVDTFLIQTLE